jgi:hypothetical protein
MERFRKRVTRALGAAVGSVLLGWAALAPAQVAPSVPLPMPVAPPYRLGLIDSRTTEVQVIPGVALQGLEVLGVVPGSPAARSGLNAGDVVLSANSARVIAPEDLRRAMAGSWGQLHLKVFQARSEQVLNVTVVLGPAAPVPTPLPVTLTGRLKVGVMAVGAETTGVTLTTADGTSYDLDFGAARPPDQGSDGRSAVVTGTLVRGTGPERPGRRVIKVSGFRLIERGRPRVEGGARSSPI